LDLPHIPPLLVIVGPTASGKTALALRAAEATGSEIVSADSVQVYRGFDIGSGKPTLAERTRVPHHLIDVANPGQAMDAASWAVLADQAVAEIRARGRRPIV
jgi:tRNA dimethylallyltransferase